MTDTLHLPRPLVNHILHQAQIAPSGRIAACNGKPYAFHSLDTHADTGARRAAIQQLAAQGDTLFALLNAQSASTPRACWNCAPSSANHPPDGRKSSWSSRGIKHSAL